MSHPNSPQQQGGWNPHHHHHHQQHYAHHQHHGGHHHHHAPHGHHHHHHYQQQQQPPQHHHHHQMHHQHQMHHHHQHHGGHHHHHHHHGHHAQHHQHQHHHQQQHAPSSPPDQADANNAPSMNQFGFSIPTPQQTNPQDDPLREYFDAIVARNPIDNKGCIGPMDLAEALSEGTYKFSGSVAEKLIKMFDRSQTGSLDFNEYKAAHQFIDKMSHGFKERDADGSGVLEIDEIKDALSSSGYRLSDPCLQLLMKKFSDKNLGGVRFDNYIGLSILLARVTQVFGYYDRNGSGLITFQFDTFIASVMSCI